MLAGRTPFDEGTASILAQQITQAPEPLREAVGKLPDRVERVAMGMLEKNPDDRPQDLVEFIDLVRELRHGAL